MQGLFRRALASLAALAIYVPSVVSVGAAATRAPLAPIAPGSAPPRITVKEPARLKIASRPAITIRPKVVPSIRASSSIHVTGPRMLGRDELLRLSAVQRRAAGSVKPTAAPVVHVPRIAALPGRSRGAQSVPGNPSASGTGIEPWWRYQEQGMPGGARLMVNVGTGNFIVQDDDMAVSHKGVAFAFRRTYNSQAPAVGSGSVQNWQGLYGNGWTNTFDAHLVATSSTQVSVYDINGTRSDYTTADAGATYSSVTPGQYAVLQWDGGCGVLWRKKNGAVYHFYSPYPTTPGNCVGSYAVYGGLVGRLYQIYGRNWNTTLNLSYSWTGGNASPTGKVSAITVQAESGLTATLTFADFSGHRLLQQLQLPDGNVISYAYDESGNLTSVTKPANNSAGVLPQSWYGYETIGADQIMMWASTPRWAAACFVDNCGGDGAYLGFAYAGTSLATSTLSSIQTFALVNVRPNDGMSQFLQSGYPTYAYAFHTEYYTTGGTTPTFRDTDGHMTNWIVDGLARPTQTQNCTATVGQAQSCSGTLLYTNEAWDANNSQVSAWDARGYRTDYTYDANGNNTARAAPQTSVMTGSGTVRFRPTELFDYDVTTNNLVASCDQRATHAANADWSASGPPTAGGPDGLCAAATAAHTTYGYTAVSAEPQGELTLVRSPLGYTHTISYDAAPQGGTDFGLQTAVRGDPIAQPDGTLQPYATTYYDKNGNIVCSSTDAGAGRTTAVVTYDGMNRPIALADPDDTSAALPAGCASRTSDIPGSTIVTHKTYFPDGSLASIQNPAEAAANVSSTVQYDLDGNEIQAQQHQTLTAGPTTKTFDGIGRLVEIVEPQDPTDFYTYPWTTRYIYDLSQGGTNTFAGSAAFRAYGGLYKTQERLPGATADWFEPGSTGTSTSGSGTFLDTNGSTFDAMDRPITKYRNTGSGVQAVVSTYDAPSTGNGVLSTTCNALNQCTAYTYDERTALVQKTFSVGSSSTQFLAYDENGRQVNASNAVGSITDLFDADGRATSRSQTVSGAPSSTIAYHFYANGLRSAIDISLSNGTSYPSAITYTYTNDGTPRRVGVISTANALQFQFTGGHRFLSRSDTISTGPISFGYGAVGPSSASSTNYPAIGLPTGINAPTFYEASMHYDPEGGFFTGDNWICYAGSGCFYPDSVLVNKKTSRGEVIGSGEHVSMANGVRIPTDVSSNDQNATKTAHYSFNALQGYPNEWDTANKCGSQCYNGSTNTDSVYTYDAVGRQTSGTDNSGSADTYTKQYDAEDQLISHQVTNGVAGAGRGTKQWSLAYQWGPAGHPFLIGSTSVVGSGNSAPTDFQYDSLYWDGDTLLFTVNPAGQVDDLKIGNFADYIPGTSTPLVVIDRDNTGQIRDCHRSGGGGAITAGSASLKAVTCDMTPAHIPARAPTSLVGHGAILVEPKIDGFTDGFNTFQGGRTFDPQAGVWNSPDSFRGSVQDPMTQKGYMWNRNDPFAYNDPSGYDWALAAANAEYIRAATQINPGLGAGLFYALALAQPLAPDEDKWMARDRGVRAAARQGAQAVIGVYGKNGDYLYYAYTLKLKAFNIPMGIWNQMSSLQRDAANMTFMKRGAERGWTFVVVRGLDGQIDPNGQLQKEIDMLMKEYGYTWNADGTALIAPKPL